MNDKENRLLLAILLGGVATLLVICVAGAAFISYAYGRSGEGGLQGVQPGVQNTPTAATLPRSRQPGTLIIGAMGAPLTLDPALVQDATSAEYVVHLFSGLLGIDDKLHIVPDLAEKWDVSPDGKTYTFTLRTNARFHDGKRVTAQDVKYSFERALDPQTGSPVASTYLGDIVGAKDKLAGRAKDVAGITVIDDSTVQITIDAPKSYFPWQLTYTVASIVDKANVEGGGRNWADKPNGTGPFKLASKSNSEIVLARNDNYYGDKPRLKEARYRLTGGGMSDYERGDADIVEVGMADIERATDPRNPLNKELSVSDQFSLSYIGLDTSKPPFDDPKVRQAIAMAIDKEKLASVVLKDMATRADGILPPGLPGYNEDLQTLDYNPEKARQLLSESKYAGKMPPIALYTLGSGAAPLGTPPAIQQMLKQNLGLDVEIQLVDSATFFNGLYQHKYPMFVTGWIADYPDAYDFLDVLFHSKSELNHGNYSNPQLDTLLDAARVERDPARRTQLYQEAEQLLVSEAPAIPLDFSRSYWLVKPYVKGAVRPPW